MTWTRNNLPLPLTFHRDNTNIKSYTKFVMVDHTRFDGAQVLHGGLQAIHYTFHSHNLPPPPPT